MEKRIPERTLFVIWRWQARELGEGGIWNTPDGKNRLYCVPDDALFDDNLRFIEDVVHKMGGGSQYLFFLHRNRHPKHYVGELIKRLNQFCSQPVKCFLFGYGSDFIYASKNPKGLLGSGELGGWVDDETGNRKEVSVIESLKDRTIRQENFESVWNYYQYEFKKKLYRLERDLFLHFAPLTSPEDTPKNVSLFKHLENDETLAQRVYSLIGEDTGELQLKQELLFDDCAENLQAAYGQDVLKAYESLRQSIDEVFLGNSLKKEPPHIAIPAVRQQFTRLRSLMPERITY